MDMNTKNLPFKINIATPCPARWEDMGGDDRVRFCDHCRKNVYNISALTTAEAAALLESKQGNLCARIYQRADGTVLTDDCPVGVARQWRRLKVLVSSGVAIMVMTLVNLSAFGRDDDKTAANNSTRPRFIIAAEDVLSKLGLRNYLRPTPTLGMVCQVSPQKQVPPPTMGKIAPTNTLTPPPAKK